MGLTSSIGIGTETLGFTQSSYSTKTLTLRRTETQEAKEPTGICIYKKNRKS